MRGLSRKCSVNQCDGKHYAHGYCWKHYIRIRKHGSHDVVMPTGKSGRSMAKRLWERVRIDENECWNWLGSKDKKGYGMIRYNTKPYRAHRLAWIEKNGDIPNGILVCHKCDNPGCINPDHLFLGSALDNTSDMDKKGRERGRFTKGYRPLKTKFTAEQIIEIRRICAVREKTQTQLAKEFHTSQGHISNIVTRKTWRNS